MHHPRFSFTLVYLSEFLPLSSLRMVPSILQGILPSSLLLWQDFWCRACFREAFTFLYGTLFYHLFFFYCVWFQYDQVLEIPFSPNILILSSDGSSIPSIICLMSFVIIVVYWPPSRQKCIFLWRGWAWLTVWYRVKILRYTHRLMHRKRVTCELHDSYFRLMTIKHAIPKTA